MTPKEKTQELIETFWTQVRDYRLQDPSMSKTQAKQCALIAVDEILEMDLPILEEEVDSFYDYWEEVRQEIEKL